MLNFKVKKGDFLKGISRVQGIITSKLSLPILSYILVKSEDQSLNVITTDLETSILTKIEAQIKARGSVCLPTKKLTTLIREMPQEEIEVNVDEKFKTILRSGNCEFKISGLNPQEFPVFPEIKEAEVVLVDGLKIKEMIKLTSFAVSGEETSYVLNGVLVEFEGRKIKFVATDGRRLSLIEKELDSKTTFKEKVNFVVAIKTINELEKILDEEEVKICFSENQVLFDLEHTKIISRLLEGKFPDYQQVIPPESESKLKIKREVFLDALKRANILTTLDYQAVELNITSKKLIITKQTPDVGEMKEEVDAEFEGKPLKIGFNPQYLIDVLRNLKEDVLEIEITHPEKPAVIRLPEFLYIVLPVRII